MALTGHQRGQCVNENRIILLLLQMFYYGYNDSYLNYWRWPLGAQQNTSFVTATIECHCCNQWLVMLHKCLYVIRRCLLLVLLAQFLLGAVVVAQWSSVAMSASIATLEEASAALIPAAFRYNPAVIRTYAPRAYTYVCVYNKFNVDTMRNRAMLALADDTVGGWWRPFCCCCCSISVENNSCSCWWRLHWFFVMPMAAAMCRWCRVFVVFLMASMAFECVFRVAASKFTLIH